MTLAGVAIGSNLGDRRAHVEWATDALRQTLRNLRLSHIIETDPVDVLEPQPTYLNAVAVGYTTLPVLELLARLQALEGQRGRTRASYHAARTLNLDMLFYGDLLMETPTLTVPHPRFRERLFVLEPLADVAPEWVNPLTGKSAAELWAAARERARGA